MEPFRIEPRIPAAAYKTYSLAAPLESHFRQASCAEIDCPQYLNGWVTILDAGDDDGRERIDYVRRHSGRRFREEPGVGSLVRFVFEPGQTCFRAHRKALEREPFYVVRAGDHRAHLGLIREHVNGEDFVDDFANHQQDIADRREQG